MSEWSGFKLANRFDGYNSVFEVFSPKILRRERLEEAPHAKELSNSVVRGSV
jgi:hypothetical protein